MKTVGALFNLLFISLFVRPSGVSILLKYIFELILEHKRTNDGDFDNLAKVIWAHNRKSI